MADLQPLLPRKIPQSVFAPIAPDLSASPEMSGAKQMPGLNPGGGGGALGVIAPPPLANIVSNPRIVANSSDGLVNRRSALEADIYKRENPVAPTTALGKIGHVAANVGNVLGNIFAPGVMSLIPGTQLGNERKVNLDQSKISDISKQQTEEAQREQTAANTAYLNARPAIEQAKIRQHLTTSLAPKGFTISDNPAAPGGFDIVQDPDSPYTKKLNALASLQDAQAERTHIQSENMDNKYQPGTPQYEEWHRKLQQADERLGVAMAGLGLRKESLGITRDNYLANNLGVDASGNALPGSMITDDGRPVGAHFSTNSRPTGQERNKGDMAASASEQLTDIKSIMQKRPELFGPGYGQSSAFRQWIGSQDPDAQRFLAARTIAADHLAGTFGGRSEAALDALDKAIGQFKDNPSAAIAGIDQLTKANSRFEKAGTMKTTGSDADSSKVKKYNPATGRLE